MRIPISPSSSLFYHDFSLIGASQIRPRHQLLHWNKRMTPTYRARYRGEGFGVREEMRSAKGKISETMDIKDVVTSGTLDLLIPILALNLFAKSTGVLSKSYSNTFESLQHSDLLGTKEQVGRDLLSKILGWFEVDILDARKVILFLFFLLSALNHAKLVARLVLRQINFYLVLLF